MRFHSPSTLAVATALATAALSGCSGGASGSPAPTSLGAPQQNAGAYRHAVGRDGALSVWPASFTPHPLRGGALRPAPAGAAKGNVAVAQFGASSVLWFPKNNRKNQPPRTCQPASSTNGIAVDKHRNLWVPNGRAYTTTEYAPNCGAALMTIADPTGEPADITFDSKGDVYIMNLSDTSGPPTVGVYDPSGTQIGTLGDASFEVPMGIGTDSHDNVYVSNLQKNNIGNVVEFASGQMPGKALSVSLGLPGKPVFDSKDNMILSDWEALTLDVFAPPYDGQPTTSPIKGSSIWCPLGSAQKRILCGDADNGSVDVYAYPGGKYLYSYTSGLSATELVTGVAPAPAAAL
jgi:hypothetical protein